MWMYLINLLTISLIMLKNTLIFWLAKKYSGVFLKRSVLYFQHQLQTHYCVFNQLNSSWTSLLMHSLESLLSIDYEPKHSSIPLRENDDCNAILVFQMLKGLGTFDSKQTSIKTGSRINHSNKETQRGKPISLPAETTEGNWEDRVVWKKQFLSRSDGV